MSYRIFRSLVTAGSCAVIAAGALVVGGPASAAPASVSPDGLFHASAPKRLLDTRSKGGSVGVNGTVTIPRSAFTAAGMPATGVQSVVLNLTVTGATGPGYAVAYGGGTAPSTSNINFVKGWTGASQATVALGSAGVVVKVGGTAGTRTQVIVDLQGWYGTSAYAGRDGVGATFLPGLPERFVDTRQPGVGALAGGQSDTWSLGRTETSSSGDLSIVPTALLVNLTATGAKGAGNLVAWSGAGTRPSTSSVNFARGETAPNLVTVPIRVSRGEYTFTITNAGSSSTDYVIDVLGLFADAQKAGMAFTKHVVVSPKRVMSFAPVAARGTATASLAGTVDNVDTIAVEGTLTAVRATAPTYLTAFGGSRRPSTSSLNAVAGQTRSNGVVLVPDEDSDSAPSRVSVYNNAGSVAAIVDITGRFDIGLFGNFGAAQRRVQQLISWVSGSADAGHVRTAAK